jgi:HPr kinase/phosphorylase
MSALVHGTAVEIDGWAVLLTGPSGSGKSDLALRLIDRGAVLVGDDYVATDDDLQIAPKSEIAGKLEVRGIGIISMPYSAPSPLRLLVELGEEGERLPASWPLRDIAGWSVPLLRLNAFAASAPIKVELALKSIIDEGPVPVRLSAR